MNTDICALESASQTNNSERIEASAYTPRKESHTLLDCPARFYGEYGAEKIDRFISYIEAYKRVKTIDDEQSLLELPHLLLDHAYAWWRGLAYPLSTWQKALQALRVQFSHITPAHIIYRDIFGKPHNSAEPFEKFINDKVELFAQLPRPAPTESVQLDMIYGLLPPDICNEIRRTDITHFAELIDKVAALEATPTNQSNTLESNTDTKDFNDNRMLSLDKIQEEHANKRSRDGTIIDEINTAASTESEEREPFIKVRRTEDLMPLIKAEDVIEQEFITERTQTAYEQRQSTDEKNTSNTEADFQIDSELMSQINNIIENCDIETAAAATSAAAITLESNTSPLPDVGFSTRVISAIQPLMSQQLSEPRLQSDAANGSCRATTDSTCETNKHSPLADIVIETIAIANDTNSGNQQPATTSSAPKKYPTRRCNFCRGLGHTQHNCQKRTRKLKDLQKNALKPTTDSAAATTVAATQRDATASAAESNTSAAETSHTALTTKLISSADVPSPKLLAARLKNPAANSPSVKCHQCGMVGYYRSICPNCSPIYFYKPPNSVNR